LEIYFLITNNIVGGFKMEFKDCLEFADENSIVGIENFG